MRDEDDAACECYSIVLFDYFPRSSAESFWALWSIEVTVPKSC